MNSLSTREKYMVVAGIAALVIFLAGQFVYLPLMDQKKELTRILAIEQDSIRQMTGLQQQYLALTRNLNREQARLADRSPQFTLFSFLDTQAEAGGVKKNIDYMRPFSQDLEDGPYWISRVRLKLKNMYLNDFIEFLKQVETSGNNVSVVSISLTQTGEKDNLLEAVLEVQTLMPRETQ